MPRASRRIRLAGYSPPTTADSRACLFFRERLREGAGEAFGVDLFWNVLDFGYRAGDLLEMTECGLLTMCYLATSYLAERVPSVGVLDLPYLFPDAPSAHRALDGALGERLAEETARATGLLPLGFWENGFRHLTNSLRPVRTPEDCRGLRIRLQPSPYIVRTFELLGMVPTATDLTELLPGLAGGRFDAQENPFSNVLTYGIHRYHRHLTLTGHLYGARGLFIGRDFFESLPGDLQEAVRASAREAIRHQRELLEREEADRRRQVEAEGVQVVDLSPEERGAFQEKVARVREEAARRLGVELLELARGA